MKKRLLICLTIFIILIFAIGGFVLIQKSNLINPIVKNTETEEKNFSNQELDINSELVQNLYKIANPSNDSIILKEMYLNESIPNYYILAMSAMAYIRDNISIDDPMVKNMMFSTTIKKDQLKKYIYKLFGNIEYQDEDFFVMNSEYGVCGFTYEKETELYVSLNGCGGSNTESFLRKIVGARQEGNLIYITEKSVFVYTNLDWNENYISERYVYKDCSQKELIDYQEIDVTINNPLNIDSYLDKATTYEYVFENNNGQYIFKNFIKI